VFAGLAASNLVLRSHHLHAAATMLNIAPLAIRQELGVPDGPITLKEFTHSFDRLAQTLAGHPEGPDIGTQQFLDAVVPPSAGTDASRFRALDTTFFDAFSTPRANYLPLWAYARRGEAPPCRHVSKTKPPARPGSRGPVPRPVGEPSDPDASGRVIDNPNGKPKKFFGYAATAMVKLVGRNRAVCEGIVLQTAKLDDAPAALHLATASNLPHPGKSRLLIDRGFSQRTWLLEALRADGWHLTFDLKSDQRDITVFKGAMVVDGGLYTALPAELVGAVRPAPNGTGWERWKELQAARAAYAWRLHGTVTPAKVVVAPPSRRNRMLCPDLVDPSELRDEDPRRRLPRCSGNHRPGDGCLRTSLTFPASAAPATWQYPFWGSVEWEDLYSKRTAVERYFSLMKYTYNWEAKHFAVRGIAKVGIKLAACVVAVNLDMLNRGVELLDADDERVTRDHIPDN
jgi:hypothetical protein